MQDSRRIAITGRGMGVAAMLAAAAGLTVVTRDAATRAADAGRALANAFNTRDLPRFTVKHGRGNANAMGSNANARRAAAKKRRVKAHRARR